jgi:hypothetical protein
MRLQQQKKTLSLLNIYLIVAIITVEDAFEKIGDVIVFEGTAEEYAMEIYEHEHEDKLGKFAYYFDYKALGRDFVLNGDGEEYKRKGKNYIITP